MLSIQTYICTRYVLLRCTDIRLDIACFLCLDTARAGSNNDQHCQFQEILVNQKVCTTHNFPQMFNFLHVSHLISNIEG